MRKTVFVLGAGASRPYSFPTAAELRRIILEGPAEAGFGSLFRGLPSYDVPTRYPDFFAQTQIEDVCSPQSVVELVHHFRRSEICSIDRFLREHPKLEDVGRAAIASVLLACEKESNPRGGWYQKLWNDLARDGAESDASWLSIISFNYDRSLLRYLRESAEAYLGKKGRALVDQIRFHHVYGHLGSLDGKDAVRYGDLSNWQTSADCIELMRPQLTRDGGLHDWLSEAERIVFLGFGFDTMNLDALGIDKNVTGDKMIFASCFHLDVNAKEEAQNRIPHIGIRWGDPAHDVDAFLHHTPWRVR